MISVQSLSKRYGSQTAVADVSFSCEPGTITGFLGPNGAGKSTTVRMITGLTRPDSGYATVAGFPFTQLRNPARKVGTLLDAAAVHPGRTGRATLRLTADLIGMPPSRADDLLEEVGLPRGAADRRVGTYSLGMRQRLGIAQAMIGEPEVLILDEPANGLDPEGIAWMRTLLRSFAADGGTVLLSSHLLGEVQATVDRLVVVGGGRVVAAGSLDELLSSAGLVLRATDPRALARVLFEAGLPHVVHEDGSTVVDTSAPAASGVDAESIARLAASHGLVLLELRQADRTGIEDLFFSLTRAGGAPGGTGRPAGDMPASPAEVTR
ncbi:ABC transporter [Frankia sp. CcI49]|uniref:ATP-binding cassette domain-containing protein n=1 Tax=unclassified Frankia TaxID=2632575 RepID=UPI0006CA486E|nr:MULTISPECIES: ATP-binding cassette domain-containing protein [unclassified Frankia]KPM56109.1 ABC transporter [Frankia sp. R43]ONH50042.1 ABC transporter [Frankia sp. CcI49]